MRSRFPYRKTLAAAALCLILLVLAGWVQAPGSASNVHVNASLVSGTPLDCATSTVRCVPSEHATIDACMDGASAGDICWVSAGTYVETASPGVSGTSGNPITLLANGAVITCGLSFTGQSYIRVIGLTLDKSTGGCAAGNTVNGTGTNTGLEFWNNTLQNNQSKGFAFDIGLGTNRCDKCIFFGNTLQTFGNPSNPTVMTISGDDMFASYNNFATFAEIGIGPTGSRIRMLNNNFSGLIEVSSGHPDSYYIAVGSTGYSNSVIESNFTIGTASAPNNKFSHNQNDSAVAWVDDVYRLNVATQVGSGIYSVYGTGNDITRMRWYHNSFALNARAVSGTPSCGSGRADSGHTVTLFFTNELYQECWSSDSTTFIDGFVPAGGAGTLTVTKDYNLGYDPDGAVSFTASWTAQAHEQSNVNPSLTNTGTHDLTLQSGSGARGVGGPLTTATSCSGTTLNVAANGAANFFGSNAANLAQYGGYLVPGDTITIGTSTTRTIISIASDAITVDSSLTCSASDPVYFGSSSTVDIGAYPYKAGGYTLTATKAQVGSTVTITPNDASLARFAVVYENLIPKCVASAANAWACTVGTGVITAKIYPRYASQTQSVVVN